MDFTGLFQQMIKLFIVIVIGFLAAKAGFITEKVNDSISKIIIFVSSPAQILSSVLKPDARGGYPIDNRQALLLTGLSFVCYFVLIAAAWALSFILKGENKVQRGLYQFMFIFSNISFIGFPVIDALFGEGYRFYVTIFVLTFNIFCWTYGITLISGEKFRFSFKPFTKPMFLAAVLAFILFFSKLGLYCPPIVYDAVSTVGNATPALAMLLIGSTLAFLSFKMVFGRWQIYVMSAVKLIIFPIVFWFFARMLIKDPIILGALVVTVSMPVGNIATAMSFQYNGDEKLASSGIFFTTLASVVTVPLVIYLLFKVWA